MNNVFPESLNHIDTSNPEQALSVMEAYIRYMCERTDHAVKNSGGSGGESAETIERINRLERETAELTSDLNNKVDKVAGSSLMTQAEHDKLASLSPYINLPVNPSDTSNINVWIIDD